METKHFEELTDAEIDAVSGGQGNGGLIGINNALNNLSVLDNAHIAVAANVLGGLALARAP